MYIYIIEIGSTVSNEISDGGNHGIMQNAFCSGLIVTAMIWAFGHFSGAYDLILD